MQNKCTKHCGINLPKSFLFILCVLLAFFQPLYVIAGFSDISQSEGLADKSKSTGNLIIYLDKNHSQALEVKAADENHTATWHEATRHVEAYGIGWRLPTIQELNLLFKHRKTIGGFSEEDYWSATEQDVNSAWIQGFRMGDQDRYNKHSKLKMRAVRTLRQ